MVVTVILPENSVNVDGTTYYVSLPNISDHSRIYSICWYGASGEYDYDDGTMPISIGESDFITYVQPYVTAWEEARIQSEKDQAADEAAEYARTHSVEALSAKFRRARDKKLSKTDFYFQPDYPAISEENMKRVQAYRTALRDMTTWEGFPWDGGGEETPWPTLTLK